VPDFDDLWERYGRDGDEAWLQFVRDLMGTHGISRTRLARQAGYRVSQVSDWLNGNVRMSMKTKLRIDEALLELTRRDS